MTMVEATVDPREGVTVEEAERLGMEVVPTDVPGAMRVVVPLSSYSLFEDVDGSVWSLRLVKAMCFAPGEKETWSDGEGR